MQGERMSHSKAMATTNNAAVCPPDAIQVLQLSMNDSLALLLLFFYPSQVNATEDINAEVYFSRAGIKILSGVANVATDWVELPKNIILWQQKDNNALTGFTEGVLRDIVHM